MLKDFSPKKAAMGLLMLWLGMIVLKQVTARLPVPAIMKV